MHEGFGAHETISLFIGVEAYVISCLRTIRRHSMEVNGTIWKTNFAGLPFN